uniref:Uncharacterized protein n=1 Tax=Anguilla anguilla TaxID=7936 RepID=A0A0E9PI91_ANGAN
MIHSHILSTSFFSVDWLQTSHAQTHGIDFINYSCFSSNALCKEAL